MERKRVVITGMGALTPVGHNVEETFTNLVNGVNGIDFIKSFDTTKFKAKLAGELKNFNLEDYFDKREIKRADRVMLLGTIAAVQAYKNAGLTENDYDPYRFGTYVSSGIGGLTTISDEIKKVTEKNDPTRLSPFFIPNSIANMTAGMISIKLGLKGPSLPIITACSASTNAIGEAFRSIQHGYLDLALAGGAEASINEVGIGGFLSLRALGTSEDVNRASIPFDEERSGFIMGEGSGIVILESYEHALKRNAKIYGEVVGYGTTSDAFHMTAPDETASGITKAIEFAILDAGIKKEEIGYINAHGTSTYLNDKLETQGFKQALKEHAYNVNISSTKSMTGHMLGATGAVESIVCLKSLEQGIIPPTINYKVKALECDLNYTPNQSVKKDIKYAMNTNLGFGGHNAVLIFKKWEEN
ncbi:3-oxoacyl-[acyl-carrier-protein] synthase [Alteracholeplasma palmae J233]|uniref:3-oxoacyl-[acyl-carrier-protein] synthase 2 n=1 Tax=Alteracholeplasma palmae (strain ATCC 49389 / J233) TaxID=1318466 RepID=U4KLG5_ALTPJ|nr:beta-ketoacyl-ACP synthase II [Alteracholeplasma palmae]CCV64668.1 3-oxoacyl-[acyl-carrier-protein] synthase [Alteracholeplasma palmae J233]